jgi:hypothetical protein
MSTDDIFLVVEFGSSPFALWWVSMPINKDMYTRGEFYFYVGRVPVGESCCCSPSNKIAAKEKEIQQKIVQT